MTPSKEKRDIPSLLSALRFWIARIAIVIGLGSTMFVVLLIARVLDIGTSELLVTKLDAGAALGNEGLIYSLPMGVLLVNVKISLRQCRVVHDGHREDPLFVLDIPIDVTVRHSVEADPSARYLISSKSMASNLGNSALNISISEEGLLQSVTSTHADQSHSIIRETVQAVSGFADGFDVQRGTGAIAYKEMDANQQRLQREMLTEKFCHPLALRALQIDANSEEDSVFSEEYLSYTRTVILSPTREDVFQLISNAEELDYRSQEYRDAGLITVVELPHRIWSRWVTDDGLDQIQAADIGNPYIDLTTVTIAVALPESIWPQGPAGGIVYRSDSIQLVAICRPSCPPVAGQWNNHPNVDRLEYFSFPQFGYEAGIPIRSKFLSDQLLTISFNSDGQILGIVLSDSVQVRSD